MEDIYEEIVRIRNNGDTAALATVVQAKGSTPRSRGSKMLVKNDGSFLGTIGGGCLEADVWEAAMKVIKEEMPQTMDFDLTGRKETREGLICGGIMQILIEPILSQPTIYIFGAGHIGFSVSKIATITGFRIVVIDDRPAYANSDRFPDADKFFIDDPVTTIPKLKINKNSYIIIACRGHLEDQNVLEQVIKTSAKYIGILGSKKKNKTVFSNLKKKGVSEKILKTIHAPIGLSIATETPEEIAVSIMAEIIDIRRRRER